MINDQKNHNFVLFNLLNKENTNHCLEALDKGIKIEI